MPAMVGCLNHWATAAHLVSRGLRPCDLPNLRLWWHGPQFLEKGKLSSEETSLSPVKECEYSKELKTGSSSDIITSSVCVSTNCVSSILSTLLRKNSDGLLRVGGRLSNSDLPYVNKHPAILPGNHNLTVQIIVNFHRKNLHTGASSLFYTMLSKTAYTTHENKLISVILEDSEQSMQKAASKLLVLQP
ncbi:uncharacterized protein TNCV_1941501 [Trichonephila clavipes]|uniref:Uncharacterized protein n=1 Tax=Trichonephila clavipes TaxID=2585209 RepID=A0A8X6SDF5_TRICX|nr:uncharacterized protein TNCV_1941501 [Trichonephila clavipes]